MILSPSPSGRRSGPKPRHCRIPQRHPQHPDAGAASDAGFTLLEILVVVAILGLLIGLVAPAALRQLGGARTSVARQSIERLSSVLDLYKLDLGSYPTTEQGLRALAVQPAGAQGWTGPYLKGETTPVDSWNRPYLYRSPSTRGGHEYDLCSRGPDAQAGDSSLICNP
jgi:general secretion pathway protein G